MKTHSIRGFRKKQALRKKVKKHRGTDVKAIFYKGSGAPIENQVPLKKHRVHPPALILYRKPHLVPLYPYFRYTTLLYYTNILPTFSFFLLYIVVVEL